MNSDPRDPSDFYRQSQKRHLADAEAWAARSRLLGNLRGVSFASCVIALGYFFVGSSWIALAIAGASLGAFLLLVLGHGRVIEAEEHARRLLLVNEHAEMRVTGRFAELPATGEGFASPAHDYAGDLDLFGKGSLFQRLSVAHTHFGEKTLSGWLSDFAQLDEIALRQRAVRELSEQLEFRQQFEAEALALSQHRRNGRLEVKPSPDPEALLQWIEAPPALLGQMWILVAAWLIPASTLAGIGYQVMGTGSPLFWIVPLLLGLALLARTSTATSAAFGAVSTTEGAFLRYGNLLGLVESLAPQCEWLVSKKAKVTQSAPNEDGALGASRAMRRFRGLVGWYDLRHNGMAYPFINALLLWDVHCTVALERWKREVGGRARSWFGVIGEMEAMSSLSGFLYDESEATFPHLDPTAPVSAEGLGHPLIPSGRRITNDLLPFGPGEALLVTGSNMSGKSTFLRALGTNCVLAFAGAPVVARSLSLPSCALGTSIRVSDSLLSGTSHFFAEVKKLARVVTLAEGSLPVLFLMDEVLHGTNSRERQVGARWVLAKLLESNAFGIITTHDEGLCELPPELMRRVRQHHFRENVRDGEMTFDYLLREGPVTSGNALRLMRQVGLDVPLND